RLARRPGAVARRAHRLAVGGGAVPLDADHPRRRRLGAAALLRPQAPGAAAVHEPAPALRAPDPGAGLAARRGVLGHRRRDLDRVLRTRPGRPVGGAAGLLPGPVGPRPRADPGFRGALV